MKVVFAAVAASAVLASASPLRVIVVSNVNAVAEPNPFAKVRFGHAVSNANVAQMMEGPPPPGRAPDAHLPFPPPPHHPHPSPHRKPHCGGTFSMPGPFRQKAIEISNAFRKTFGLPLIETGLDYGRIVHAHGGKEMHGGMIHIMPFIGTSGGDKELHGLHSEKFVHAPIWNYPGGGGPHDHYPPPPPPPFFPPPPHRHHGHHGHHHSFEMMELDDSFMVRLQNALMSLGPWEGRAVAFVVGAGIGVLLRMIWVLGVVAYRGCSNDREYAAIADHDDDDEDDDDDDVVLGTRFRRTPISAPPSYVYPVDEKVRIEEEDAVVVVVTKDVECEAPKSPAAGNN